MNLVIIGSGYVGLVTAACFADFGHNVTCVDIDSKKVKSLQNGIIPIFEPGLEALVKTNLEKKYLCFTTDLGEALKNCHVVFIAVGTPACQDGKTDMKYMWNAAAEIGSKMQGDIRIVNKSTVPVGSADKTRQIISEELKKRGKSFNFSVLSIPEFLKEGTAIEDCMRPARIVIGADCEKDVIFMKKLYKPFILQAENVIVMDIKSAEMTKYAANSMLAAKISFINEIAAICEKNGANIQSVRKGIGSDPRIGYHFIYPGVGYGGSCLPKDILALINTAKTNGFEPQLLQTIYEVNERQRRSFAEKIIARFSGNLKGKKIAVWGLSFKPNTDDMREAPSICIINMLLERGALVSVYDPQAMAEAKQHYLKDTVEYCLEKYEAAKNADALILITEWSEFRNPDFKLLKEIMKTPVIFDGRNQYDAKELAQTGFECYQTGMGSGL